MELKLMFKLNNTTPTKNNQRSSSNPRNMQIAQPGINMDQDRQMLMIRDNIGNQFKSNAWQIAGNQNGYNAVHNDNLQEASTSGTQTDNALVYDLMDLLSDMQQKIERLQAQLGDLKGKRMDTQCASDALDLLSHKLKDENVSLEFQYVNGMNSKKNQRANVLKSANQKKHKLNVKNSKKLGSDERLASPRPSKPITCLRWLPTRRTFDLCGKITVSSNTESDSDTSVYETPEEEH
nr:hypothetical protein [Tanacetum cinerariifolium]